jgi:hypothetical protein
LTFFRLTIVAVYTLVCLPAVNVVFRLRLNERGKPAGSLNDSPLNMHGPIRSVLCDDASVTAILESDIKHFGEGRRNDINAQSFVRHFG